MWQEKRVFDWSRRLQLRHVTPARPLKSAQCRYRRAAGACVWGECWPLCSTAADARSGPFYAKHGADHLRNLINSVVSNLYPFPTVQENPFKNSLVILQTDTFSFFFLLCGEMLSSTLHCCWFKYVEQSTTSSPWLWTVTFWVSPVTKIAFVWVRTVALSDLFYM